MSESRRDIIDLAPQHWRSADMRPKPAEPIFGKGWPVAVAVAIVIVAAAALKYYEVGTFWFVAGAIAAIGVAAFLYEILSAVADSIRRD